MRDRPGQVREANVGVAVEQRARVRVAQLEVSGGRGDDLVRLIVRIDAAGDVQVDVLPFGAEHRPVTACAADETEVLLRGLDYIRVLERVDAKHEWVARKRSVCLSLQVEEGRRTRPNRIW